MSEITKAYRESHASEGYGEVYSKTYEKGYYAYQWRYLEKPLLEKVFSKIKDSGAKRYLDFACGTGRILSVGEKYFDETTGVDISGAMLKIAQKNCKKSLLIERDITKEPLVGTFDVITSFRFFLNAEKSLADIILDRLKENLSNDGVLVVNIHVNKSSPLGYAYRFRNALKGNKIANTMGYSEFKIDLENHGFSVEEVVWYSHLPRTGWYLEWVPKYLMIPVEKVFNKLFFLPKKMSQSFLLVCKKTNL